MFNKKVSLSLLSACAFSTLVVAESKPNIVFILADDLGWGDVGFNGQKKIKTPNIDALANDGAIFTNLYAGSTVCGPSRAVLLTGLHTGHCNIRNNPRYTHNKKATDLKKTDNTFAKELKKAGYATALYGKWGLDENNGTDSGHPLNQGFDDFCGFLTHIEAHFHWPDYVWQNRKKIDLGGKSNWKKKQTYADDLFTEKGIQFIDKYAGKKSFCLFLSYTAPHLGVTAPKKSWKQYENLGRPKGKASKGHYNHDTNLNVSYAAMVSKLDDYVGKIRQQLKKHKVDKNTLIIFTSDNGPEFDKENFFDSNGVYKGMKRDLYEGGIKVPGAAYWPGTVKPGTIIDSPFAFWDVLPTFCDIAGISPTTQTTGISFLPALKSQKQHTHDYLYWEYNKKGTKAQQAARFGKWKVYRVYNGNPNDPIELYDLEKDPGETNNLAGLFPEVASRAQEVLAKARIPSKDFPLIKAKKSKRK